MLPGNAEQIRKVPSVNGKNRVLILAGVAVVSGLLAVLLARQIEVKQDGARASACRGCFTCIAVAMHRYHEEYGHFPPAYRTDASGKPAHSWRVLLLEFIDRELYTAYKFDEPWDGPNNRKLESQMPSCYACPADDEGEARWRTNYFVVVGDQTMFPGSRTIGLASVTKPRSSVILLVESLGQNVHWMEPKDLSFESMSFVVNDSLKPSVSSRHRNGPSVCMVDGTKRLLTNLEENLRKALLITESSGEQ